MALVLRNSTDFPNSRFCLFPNTWYLWECPHLISLKLRNLLCSPFPSCFSSKDFACCDSKRGGTICQLISVGNVCSTFLSRLSLHAIQKREKPTATILVCAMHKCDFVLLTDAKVMQKKISQLYFSARGSNELYNFHIDHELEQKSCELRFATTKNLWTLSSGQEKKIRLMFCQGTRISAHGVQTDHGVLTDTGYLCSNKGFWNFSRQDSH